MFNKKRYHYSRKKYDGFNNRKPNATNLASPRQNNDRRHSYFPKPDHNIRTGASTINITRGIGNPPHNIGTNSRYNPNSIPFKRYSNGKLSTEKRISNSRYNPNASIYVSAIERPKSVPITINNTRTISRYSGTNTPTLLNTEQLGGFHGSRYRKPVRHSIGKPNKVYTGSVIPHEKRYNASSVDKTTSYKREANIKHGGLLTSLGSSLINSVKHQTKRLDELELGNDKGIKPDLSKKFFNDKMEVENELEKQKLVINTVGKDISIGKTTAINRTLQHEEGEKEEHSICEQISKNNSTEYEYISDPALLITDLTNLKKHLESKKEKLSKSWQVPINKHVSSCIYPLTKVSTQLAGLRERLINSKTNLAGRSNVCEKTTINSLKEYDIFNANILEYSSNVREKLYQRLSAIEKYKRIHEWTMENRSRNLKSQWDIDVSRMISANEPVTDFGNETQITETDEQYSQPSSTSDITEDTEIGLTYSIEPRPQARFSRRLNRADFVDDSELEEAFLQIDPDYRHHQLAVTVPDIIKDPIKKLSTKYNDVTNLVTDKNDWASRIYTDGQIDFSKREHDLFVKAYLIYPKKFGKISKYMGGLRSCEECVLHYYRTKHQVNYKKLIKLRNKRRIQSTLIRRSKRKLSNDTAEEEDDANTSNTYEDVSISDNSDVEDDNE
ncbi:SANT/Myb-like DNA-binding domain-containing protein NDAI_0B00470 [Naumovozyma dairenensis CBS 421]|uniref:SANT domain-containing protein n=1 Tax=Naumovozyma dairenensis (strain ATCC 10597 / BCRC 20456 / CBS 421 / NBRC 0211 / NRRL Y-12639) TaxID=1071378 RepID=G0W5M0_NAUDC|nr:hypothetical protein NDAI_0B00470 [Naumovozyma dairenensis CBS 421]CCD23081.1 hypothetical protein NDAI_0B00470 [Naumovozyma dairenensis CBS 421]